MVMGMKTHKVGDAHSLYPFVQSLSSRQSLTQNAYPFYGHPHLSIPCLHHIHHTSIMIIVNFVQHNQPTTPTSFFVLYELILWLSNTFSPPHPPVYAPHLYLLLRGRFVAVTLLSQCSMHFARCLPYSICRFAQMHPPGHPFHRCLLCSRLHHAVLLVTALFISRYPYISPSPVTYACTSPLSCYHHSH